MKQAAGTALRPIPLHADRGVALVRGSGVFAWDRQGRRYLDLMSNYGVNLLGYAHPEVDRAVAEQLQSLTNTHQSFDSF